MASFVSTFATLAPIFALALLGFFSAKIGIISQEASTGLNEFVNKLAIPALLFRTVIEAKTPDINPLPYWGSYFIALGVVWVIADLLAHRTGRVGREAAVIGFSSAQSNTVMVGLPVILSTLGEAGKLPVVILLSVNLAITMSAVTLIIARGESGGLRALFTTLLTNSIMLAVLAGILFRYAGLTMPKTITSILRMVGDTASPCALVAMGMSMVSISFGGARLMIFMVSLLKLIVHPALVYGLAVYVFKLPPAYAASAVIFAACPTGIQGYLVAERFKAGAVVASGAIAFSTLAAAFTMTIAVTLALALMK